MQRSSLSLILPYELLHKNIKDRKKWDDVDLDQRRRNFVGLHRDLIALGYAFKDRGEEGDLAC